MKIDAEIAFTRDLDKIDQVVDALEHSWIRGSYDTGACSERLSVQHVQEGNSDHSQLVAKVARR